MRPIIRVSAPVARSNAFTVDRLHPYGCIQLPLAREGRLDEAKEVQAAYQQAVSSAYAAGDGYEDAHKAGRAAAARRMDQLEVDAYLDDVQDVLSGASVGLSLLSFGCLVAAPETAGVSGAPALWLFAGSAAVSAANAGITMYRQQTDFVDDKSATVTYLLSFLSAVPVLDVGASAGGAALEWRD